MRQFTVEMRGTWTRAWPNQPIPLYDCTFKGDESRAKGFFRVSTEIEAQNNEEARLQGQQRIEEACYLFEFCLGGSMMLERNQLTITERGNIVSEGLILAGLQATVYSPEPPTPDQLQSLNDIQDKIKQSDWLRKVIRWWAEARRDSEPIDRFIKLWVAFEVLTKAQSNSKKFLGFAKESLIKLYPNYDGEKIRRIINDIQDARSDIFLHGGEWDLEAAQKRCTILQAILEDLLINYLGWSPQFKARQFFS